MKWFSFIRSLVIGLSVMLTSANVFGSRVNYQFKDVSWTLQSSKGNEKDFQLTTVLEKGDCLSGIITLDDAMSPALVMHLYELNSAVTCYLNDQKIESDSDESTLFADVTGAITAEEIHLKLVLDTTYSKPDLIHKLKYSQISALNSVNIVDLKLFEDAFFGGKGVQVTVGSFIGKDIDGKLIASIVESDKNQEIARNNNCAFARSGATFDVEINFPEADVIKRNRTYVVHVMLVDKEKNEEIIDEFELPMLF